MDSGDHGRALIRDQLVWEHLSFKVSRRPQVRAQRAWTVSAAEGEVPWSDREADHAIKGSAIVAANELRD